MQLNMMNNELLFILKLSFLVYSTFDRTLIIHLKSIILEQSDLILVEIFNSDF
jgi:hypothetical protein